MTKSVVNVLSRIVSRCLNITNVEIRTRVKKTKLNFSRTLKTEFLNKTNILFYFILFYLAFTTRAGSPQQRVSHYCGPVLPIPPCQHSLLEETGVPGENPRLSA